jgi:hypothetical protein
MGGANRLLLTSTAQQGDFGEPKLRPVIHISRITPSLILLIFKTNKELMRAMSFYVKERSALYAGNLPTHYQSL